MSDAQDAPFDYLDAFAAASQRALVESGADPEEFAAALLRMWKKSRAVKAERADEITTGKDAA